MKPFKNIQSVVMPLCKVNVDTDQIIPKQFLKLVKKTGFGKYLFFNWRYDLSSSSSEKKPNSNFILNFPQYKNSKILLTGENFGCGSSREHAVWALMDYGFAVIIAPSFADIFYSNCFKNGLLPICLDKKAIDKLNTMIQKNTEINIDLKNQIITSLPKSPNSSFTQDSNSSSNFNKEQYLQYQQQTISFYIDPHKKKILLEGLDEIAQTLRYEDKITQFEEKSTVPSVL